MEENSDSSYKGLWTPIELSSCNSRELSPVKTAPTPEHLSDRKDQNFTDPQPKHGGEDQASLLSSPSIIFTTFESNRNAEKLAAPQHSEPPVQDDNRLERTQLLKELDAGPTVSGSHYRER